MGTGCIEKDYLWQDSSLTSHPIFIRQTSLPTSCRENALVHATLFLGKENSDFLFPQCGGTLWRLANAKSHRFWWFMPSRPTTPISKKVQKSSDLDSEVTVLVPRQTEVSMSVWGKPSELGISLLSTNQRTFIYTGPHWPQAFSWRPSKEPGGAGFEARGCDNRLHWTLTRLDVIVKSIPQRDRKFVCVTSRSCEKVYHWSITRPLVLVWKNDSIMIGGSTTLKVTNLQKREKIPNYYSESVQKQIANWNKVQTLGRMPGFEMHERYRQFLCDVDLQP